MTELVAREAGKGNFRPGSIGPSRAPFGSGTVARVALALFVAKRNGGRGAWCVWEAWSAEALVVGARRTKGRRGRSGVATVFVAALAAVAPVHEALSVSPGKLSGPVARVS